MKRWMLVFLLFAVIGCALPLAGYVLAQKAFPVQADSAASYYAENSILLPRAASGGTAAPDKAGSAVPGEAAAEEPPFLIQDESTGEVLSVAVRDYLIGAVASEMPITWPDAALQAQAVAAHSYVLYCAAHNDTASMGGAYLTADPARRQGFMTDAVLHSYWGTDYDANYARLSALVDEVLDTVALYGDAPAGTSYFAISNGKTESSENVWGTPLPYLQSVDSIVDKAADGYTADVTFSSQQMYDLLVLNLGLSPDGLRPENYFQNYTYTDAGYVNTVDVCGISVKGSVLRSALSLRSSCFSIAYADNEFTVTTFGYGHGVGLSQWGAKLMAESGSTWQQILEHYFPGTVFGSAKRLER